MITDIPEDRILFLSVPDSLGRSAGDFALDPSIPIPVEIPPGVDAFDLNDLSWEMMLAGMLRVIARDPAAERSDYYRRFALAVKPELLSELTETAVLKAKNGELEDAERIFALLRSVFPGSAVVALDQALVLEQRSDALERAGEAERAEEYAELAFSAYKAVLDADTPLPDAFFNVGFFYMKRGNFEKALEAFSKYGEIGKDENKLSKAAAIASEIRSRQLDDEAIREAYDFIRMGKEEEGIRRARDFLERQPEIWNGWFVLGWGLRRLERWADAAACFRKALEYGGGVADTRNELAICLIELGELEAAKAELREALKTDGDNAKIVSNLGVVELRGGNEAEAARYFRAALEIEPEDPVAKEYLKSLEG